MLMIVDNYDSFVFNIGRYCTELGEEVRFLRNDVADPAMVAQLAPDALLISPGPGTPSEAGYSMELVRRFSGQLPLLGVCLGHECIGEVFGGRVTRAQVPMHGRAGAVHHDGRGLFEGLPTPFSAGRYHSLVVEPTAELRATTSIDARSPEGEIMALSHLSHPTYGVQFHPESVLTEYGHDVLANFLAIARRWHRDRAA